MLREKAKPLTTQNSEIDLWSVLLFIRVHLCNLWFSTAIHLDAIPKDAARLFHVVMLILFVVMFLLHLIMMHGFGIDEAPRLVLST